jgi:hypothetical protein
MPLYPLPAVMALLGWMFVFVTSKPIVVVYGVASLLLGVFVFAAWSALGPRLSFEPGTVEGGSLASPEESD